MEWIVIGIACLLVVGSVLYFILVRNRPENASGHSEPDRVGSAWMYGDVNDRPGGPGSEDDGVAGPGQVVPGPSAENMPWAEDRRAHQIEQAAPRRRPGGSKPPSSRPLIWARSPPTVGALFPRTGTSVAIRDPTRLE